MVAGFCLALRLLDRYVIGGLVGGFWFMVLYWFVCFVVYVCFGILFGCFAGWWCVCGYGSLLLIVLF